ncbi:MAG: zinc-ribbon domain-containing protein [Candidatus Heimdallarchaeaceae archaeon]
MKYCTKCGTKTPEDAVFCYVCGTKIDDLSVDLQKSTKDKVSDHRHYYPHSSQQIDDKYYKDYIHKEHVFLKILAIVFIIGMITASISLFAVFSSFRMDVIGTQNYYLEEANSNEVFLNIYNGIGDIDIIFTDDTDIMVEINVIVLGRKNVDESEFAEFKINDYEKNLTIEFDSGEQIFSFFNKKILEYDISITLNSKLVLYADVQMETGDFYLDINCQTANINNLNIVTKTGDVSIYAYSTENVTINNVYLVSTTGQIQFSLSDEGANYISNVFATTTTGKIFFDFGRNSIYNGNEIELTTTTGKIVLYCTNMQYLENVTWLISTSTGSVYANITQDFIIEKQLQISFFVTVNTGSIEILAEFHDDIGYLFEATTDTGTITIPEQSPNYDTALNKYYFSLSTDTGNIMAEL